LTTLVSQKVKRTEPTASKMAIVRKTMLRTEEAEVVRL
jgi:hypothetical protein